MSDTMRRAVNSVRNFAEDTLERVERRWDQAMDVIHARPIRDPVRDALDGGEQFAAQARERLDYQLRHPGAAEYAERHADLAGDATVDKSQINKIIRKEAGQVRNEEQSNTREQLLEKFAVHRPVSWGVVGNRQILPFVDSKENKTVSNETHYTKSDRQRESMAWTKVEKIGRQAVAQDRATQTQTQTQTPKSKADEDLDKAKPRQSQTP